MSTDSIIRLDISNITIGSNAGGSNRMSTYNQGDYGIAIGYEAAARGSGDAQGEKSIAIGYLAGNSRQQQNAVAVGSQAGNKNQESNAVALGPSAGYDRQGENSVALGYLAGQNNQAKNSIVINSSGVALDTKTTAGTSVPNGFFIKTQTGPPGLLTTTAGGTATTIQTPGGTSSNFTHYLVYDPRSGEIRAQQL